jgi:predicted homoserine dehydrogenase-like protein
MLAVLQVAVGASGRLEPAGDRMTNIVRSGLAADLFERGRSGRPIRIGLIGCGEMGTDILTQVLHMPGLVVGAIAARNPAGAHHAALLAGHPADHLCAVDGPPAMLRAIERGQIALVGDAALVASCDLVDVVVDATGRPAVGAEIGLAAMEHGKHLVMMNVEADVTIGAYLKHEADRLGVVYSLGAGDEPSAAMELIDFVSALGYPIVAAGKGKNNPLNIDATPDLYQDEARRRNMNPRMLVEFVDGSKTAVEMSAIANATGLVPDTPGMHGPSATVDQLHRVLCPQADGGILGRRGVVDYTVGKGVAPGVFVVAELAHPRLRERMNDLHLGAGPYYTFFRPYHLTSLEVPLTCARVVLYGKPDMCPLPVPSAEVCALAKKDLRTGDLLDAIGEYSYRAWAMQAGDARARNAMPCGLAEGSRVTRAVRKGELLTYDNCAPDPQSRLVVLRQRQDELVFGH